MAELHTGEKPELHTEEKAELHTGEKAELHSGKRAEQQAALTTNALPLLQHAVMAVPE